MIGISREVSEQELLQPIVLIPAMKKLVSATSNEDVGAIASYICASHVAVKSACNSSVDQIASADRFYVKPSSLNESLELSKGISAAAFGKRRFKAHMLVQNASARRLLSGVLMFPPVSDSTTSFLSRSLSNALLGWAFRRH